MKHQAIRLRSAVRRLTRRNAWIATVVKWAFIFSAAFGGAYGFIAGVTSDSSGYDPHTFALGISFLFAIACVAIAALSMRLRWMKKKMRAIVLQSEAMADRNWELKEAEERARSLFETQGDLIVLRDASGRITFANDAFCALARKPRAELTGTIFALEVLVQGETAIAADGTRMHDQQIATPAGPRWIAWREGLVRRDAGQPAEWQSVGRDVTDRAETEHALEDARDQAHAASRAKSRFLAMASHEIRTPLNGILGMSGLLLDTKLTPEQATYVNAVKSSGDALLSLIEELLDYSKIEAGKIDLAQQPFGLTAMMEDITELLAPRAHAKGIEIACYVDERLPVMVSGDAARLRQVLLNLAGNAIKFTSQGGVALIAEPGIWEGEISFLVRDTGIGIEPEAQERIFREFEQASEETARDYGGTGLGLSISDRIVKRMGGRIVLESKIGHGSTFEVSIPLTAAASDVIVAAQPESWPDLSGKPVMIVTAQPVEASLVEKRLARWGAQVCIVSDIPVAEALLPERHWHALLIDGSFGHAAQMLAHMATAHTQHRIIMLTPAMRHDTSMMSAPGFTGYLVKPLRAASLAARLSSVRDTDTPIIDASDAPPIAARAAGSGLSILVAEDNEINALLMRSLLGKLGHRAVIAVNGEQALESWLMAAAAGAPYDVVLMDVQMPVLDGVETAKRIRAAEAGQQARRTPILALTANALVEDRYACFEAGMDGFLVKPLDRDKLATALAGIRSATPLVA
ncbi:MAG: response regulator [Pseudomonadota bacterium]